MRHDVHVDVARVRDDLLGGARHHQRPPPRPSGAADDDLGRVDPARDVEDGLRRVRPGHRVPRAAELVGQPPQRREAGQRWPTQPVGPGDVHGEQLATGAARGDPSPAPEQRLPLGAAGESHDHTLTGGPGRVDAVVGAVPSEPLVDPVGEPEQGQLAQRREVADPEVVRQGGVDLLGLVDVAVGHPPAQRLGGHVDELDLVGPPHHLVGHRLPLHHTGDRLDHVVQRLEVLDVDGRDDVDPGIQHLVDVLPALLVARPRHVGVRELVDQRDGRAPGQQRVEVHVLEGDAPVLEPRPGHDLEALDHLRRVLAPVGLDQPDDHVGATGEAPAPLVEHRDGLADPGGRPEVDAMPTACHGLILTDCRRRGRLPRGRR